MPNGIGFDPLVFAFDPASAGTTWLAPDGRSDAETGLRLNGIRYVQNARFVSRDPTIFWPGDLLDANLYAYGSNNPVLYADPTGLNSEAELLVGLFIASLIIVLSNPTNLNAPENGGLTYDDNQGDMMFGAMVSVALVGILVPLGTWGARVLRARLLKDLPKAVPQGLSPEQFDTAIRAIRSQAAQYGDDVVVHGSRASGTAAAESDIDFAIRVTADKFDEIIEARFGNPTVGTAKYRQMLHAKDTGKIQRGELGLSGVGRQLEGQLGMEVDISVVRIGGPFDSGPYIVPPPP